MYPLDKKLKLAYWSKMIAVHALSMVVTLHPAVSSWYCDVLYLVIQCSSAHIQPNNEQYHKVNSAQCTNASIFSIIATSTSSTVRHLSLTVIDRSENRKLSILSANLIFS